jgi:hypothetical protein
MSTTTDSCAICRNPLNNGQRTESPGECNHIFHEACIDNLVTYAKDGSNIPCPLCRKNLVPPHMRGNDYNDYKFGGKRTLKAKGKRSLRKTKTKRKRKTKTKRKTKSKSRKTGVKRKKY